jgi:hypothetical protein
VQHESDQVAVRLTAKIGDLAEALARAQVPLLERSRLLELAALAALQAVTLDSLDGSGSAVEPAPVTRLSAAPSLRAAAA